MTHDEYLNRRDELLKIRAESFDSFDKAVLSLATGSLALSITFLDKIGAPFSELTYCLIFATWISLFGVILANLLSYLFAKSNMDRKIEELDANYQDELGGKAQATQSVEKTFWQRMATNICNNVAFGVFFLSILFFTAYIVAIQRNNYRRTRARQKEDTAMVIRKTAGATEVTAPVAKQAITEGKTEAPKAIPSQVVAKILAPTQTVIRGQTEAPQAVQKPSQPAASNNSGKK